MKRFLAWFTEVAPKVAKDPRRATGEAEVQCFGRDEYAESARGTCLAELKVNDDDASTYSLNWTKTNPRAFKAAVIVQIPGEIGCGHFGGTTLPANPANGPNTRCKLPGGIGAAFHAMGPSKQLMLFTDEYLKQDPELEQ